MEMHQSHAFDDHDDDDDVLNDGSSLRWRAKLVRKSPIQGTILEPWALLAGELCGWGEVKLQADAVRHAQQTTLTCSKLVFGFNSELEQVRANPVPHPPNPVVPKQQRVWPEWEWHCLQFCWACLLMADVVDLPMSLKRAMLSFELSSPGFSV